MRAIIVEDEQKNRKNLEEIIKEYGHSVKLIASCSSAEEARRKIIEQMPDLVFLDVEMPGGDGFSLLKSLPEINFEVIFVTAFSHYSIQAIKFSALDYILKPIENLELIKAINKAEKRIAEKQENVRLQNLLENANISSKSKRIALSLHDKLEFIEISSIIRCESDDNYTTFFLKTGGKLLVSKPLKEYDELLSPYGFLRIHQSHLINLEEVKSYVKSEGGYIKMKDGSSVSISRQRREMVINRLKGL